MTASTRKDERRSADVPVLPMVIGGRAATGARVTDVIGPATGAVVGRFHEADTALAQRAVDAARQGFETWSATSPEERRSVILRFAARLEEPCATRVEIVPFAWHRGEVLAA